MGRIEDASHAGGRDEQFFDRRRRSEPEDHKPDMPIREMYKVWRAEEDTFHRFTEAVKFPKDGGGDDGGGGRLAGHKRGRLLEDSGEVAEDI